MHNTSLSRAAFQRLDAQSSNIYRSVIDTSGVDEGPKCIMTFVTIQYRVYCRTDATSSE